MKGNSPGICWRIETQSQNLPNANEECQLPGRDVRSYCIINRVYNSCALRATVKPMNMMMMMMYHSVT